MTVYVTGDVHGRAEYGSSRFAFKNWPLGRTLTRDDAVIVAGDFGFVWDGSNAEKYWLDWFESKPWTTCFVDGNHENHRMLAELPVREWNGGLVHEARPHVLHLMRGEVYDIAGTTVLTMGGAASMDAGIVATGCKLSWASSKGGSTIVSGSSGITTATNGATTGIAWSIETSCRSKVLRPVLSSRNPLEML